MKNTIIGLVGVAAIAGLAFAAAPAGGEKKADAPAAKAGEKKTILATAEAAGSFKTLGAAIKAAGLEDALNGAGPFTVFAPTDAAFEKLGKEKIAELLKPENKEKLASILKFHVIAGSVKAGDVVKMKESSKTLQGTAFQISVKDKTVMIGNDKGMATVTKTDIEASNGVIHVIDSVIIPADAKKADKPAKQ